MRLPRELAREGSYSMPLSRHGVAGITSLGRYHYTHASPGLEVHAHAGRMEICYLVRGSQNYRFGGRDYRLRGGDVFITFPNEQHSTGDQPQEKGVLYWMIIELDARQKSPLLGLPRAQGGALRHALLNLKKRLFRGSRRMQDHLDAITAAYHAPDDPLCSCAMTNHAVAFLLEVAACGQQAAGPVRGTLQQEVLRQVRARFDESPTVPELARYCGLSAPRFKVRFKEEAGLPPAEYVLRVKVAEAQVRLTQTAVTVTDVAFALGFATSQYFATVFKRFTRQTPRDYRALHAQSAMGGAVKADAALPADVPRARAGDRLRRHRARGDQSST